MTPSQMFSKVVSGSGWLCIRTVGFRAALYN